MMKKINLYATAYHANASIIENGNETIIAPNDRQFNSKTVGQRAMTIFAGPLFNFILAFFIFYY